MIKVDRQLTDKQPIIKPHSPKQYQPQNNTYLDLYRHGIHCVITEYSAVCLYLWLMSRTSGSLQTVFAELLEDEINHMTKFWGFGVWLFPKS